MRAELIVLHILGRKRTEYAQIKQNLFVIHGSILFIEDREMNAKCEV